jgi:hypothetical protein
MLRPARTAEVAELADAQDLGDVLATSHGTDKDAQTRTVGQFIV